MTEPKWRELPRVFLSGVHLVAGEPVPLPSSEVEKLVRVLRLPPGASIAVLPNDGSLWRARLAERSAIPETELRPDTNLGWPLVLAQGTPRHESLEEVVRMGTEQGVTEFWLFPADRTVVKWDEAKRAKHRLRLEVIARESAEVCGRTILPVLRWVDGLAQVLHDDPSAIVLSESELLDDTLESCLAARPAEPGVTLVIGPEGGWSPAEVRLIGDRAVTLGSRVLRVDTAAAAAIARTIGYFTRPK